MLLVGTTWLSKDSRWKERSATGEAARHRDRGHAARRGRRPRGPAPQVFGLTQLFLGGIIIVVMKFRPGGLLGDRELDELLLSVTTRRRLEVPPRDPAPELGNVTGP
jgi:hypothetical protein